MMRPNRFAPFLIAALFAVQLVALGGCSLFAGKKAAQAEATPAAAPAGLQHEWGTDVDQRRPMSAYSFSRPVLAGKLIVVGGQDSFAHIYNRYGHEVRRVALTAPSNSGGVALSPDLVVIGDEQGVVYGIDPKRGKVVWRLALPTVMPGHPVRIGNDVLVQTGDNNVFRISAAGKQLWSFSGTPAGLSMNITPSPVVAGDTCYALMTNGDAVAMRSDNGDLVWRHQLLLNNDAVVLSQLKTPMADPVVVGDVLVVSFYQGDIYALSTKDGEQLWQRNISLKSAPLVEGGHLYIATAKGAVMELDPTSGATLWKRDLGAGELVGPVMSEHRLIAADDHGRIFAVGLDGRVDGEASLPGRIDRLPLPIPGGVLLRNNLGGLYLIR